MGASDERIQPRHLLLLKPLQNLEKSLARLLNPFAAILLDNLVLLQPPEHTDDSRVCRPSKRYTRARSKAIFLGQMAGFQVHLHHGCVPVIVVHCELSSRSRRVLTHHLLAISLSSIRRL